MRIGQIFRYPSNISVEPIVDSLPNWYFETKSPADNSWSAVKLDSGINSSAIIDGSSQGVPFIAIRSSPHRFGSSITPWEDIHRPDQGYSRYFGDNKPGVLAANQSRGNKKMLDAFIKHSGSKEDRLAAPPILIFEGTSYEKRVKGQLIFHGVGIITRAELVVQRDPSSSTNFANYVYDIAIFDLTSEHEKLDWAWINARRNPELNLQNSLKLAPLAWQKWVEKGPAAIPRLRRNVITRNVVKEEFQKPVPFSEDSNILNFIYDHYQHRKLEFESLAEFVTQQVFSKQGISYTTGWITQGSGDGGFDFVSAVDLDPVGAIRSSRQVVLEQAKCEKLTAPTNGNDIARLAARLRRGWIGMYVTTSYFSVPVQREVLIDRYPIVLIDGGRIASVVRNFLFENNISLNELLDQLSSEYKNKIGYGDPDTILNY